MLRLQSFKNNKPCLYVIATPIGNLNEISPRVSQALNECNYVFCEDTRVTKNLLNHLNITKELVSAFENIERKSSERVIELLKQNQNVAYMSDAGYPTISDPGSIIIKEVIKNEFNVVVVNGPSAAIHSLVASGFDASHFYFYGFLDPKEEARKKELQKLKDFEDTLIFYQSPHKILACLTDMLEVLGDRKICLCRELTKMYEEFIHGTISELIPICETLKGEMVLIVSGNEIKETIISLEEALNIIEMKVKQGMKASEAIKEVSSLYNLNKKELYNMYQKERN